MADLPLQGVSNERFEGRPPVIRVVGPTPSQKHVHIEEVFHGKSASISRTNFVSIGGWSGKGAKIIAPVNSHFTCVGAPIVRPTQARRLRYSETLSFSRFARDRISRASSSVTLNVKVFMGITVLPGCARFKRNVEPSTAQKSPQAGACGLWVRSFVSV